jgi:basic amino acid/polyamine antiporter, APA family
VPWEDEGGLRATVFALALLWAITGVHLAGGGAGGALQRTLTVLKVGAMLVLIAAGLLVGAGDWAHLRGTEAQGTPGFGSWCVALILALYVRIPRESCHRFQVNLATDSTPKLPPVPHECCH